MRKRKTEKEKKEEKKRKEAYHHRVFYNSLVRKANELNKILNSRDTTDVKCYASAPGAFNVKINGQLFIGEGAYTVTFKDGQVFKFKFFPDSLFGKKTIIVKEPV